MKERKSRRSNQLAYRVETRVNAEKYAELTALLAQSRHQTMSEIVRDILYNRKIIVETHDNTLDKLMEQLSGIRKELQSIGVNINQVTHYFHLNKDPEAKLFNVLEIAKLYQQTDKKVSVLLTLMAQLSLQWLPG